MNCTTNSCGCTNPGSCTNPCELVVRGMLVARIIERFRFIVQEIHDESIPDKDGPWSRKIFTRLGELGQELGCSICCDESKFPGANFGGWLWDMIWSRNDSLDIPWTEAKMLELLLALEWEWGNRAKVLEDFPKLLVARASVRLMGYSMTQAGDMTEELLEHIHAFKHNKPGDTYLLVAYNEDKKGNWWFEYVVIVVNDKRTTDIVEKGKIMNGEIHRDN